MKYEYAALSDVGRVRENNEDSVVFNDETGVVVLADGMGGYNAGEVASGMSTALLEQALSQWIRSHKKNTDTVSADGVHQLLSTSLNQVNQAVLKESRESVLHRGMGTTLVLGVLLNDSFLIAHLGDSRCYLLRDEELIRLTKDHSMLQEYLDMGLITPAEAPFCAWKNLVTRAIGVEDKIEPDFLEQPVVPGDVFLFCSDGLTDMLNDAEIAEMLKNRNNSLEVLAQDLVDSANAMGGKDNISVILVEAQKSPKRQALAVQLGQIFSK